MRDTLDRSTSVFGLAWRLLLGLAVMLIVPPLACVGLHNLRHPAPLGRSRDAILNAVDAALPPGTTADSARRFLAARGVSSAVYPPTDAARTFPGDSLLAGGPVVVARLPAVARDLYVWNASLTLYFDPRGRLARREAQLSAENPL